MQKVRMQLGITQQELGDLLDISKNYVWMLESGAKPISKKVMTRLTELERSKNSHQTASQKPLSSPPGLAPQLDRISNALERIAGVLEKMVTEQEVVK